MPLIASPHFFLRGAGRTLLLCTTLIPATQSALEAQSSSDSNSFLLRERISEDGGGGQIEPSAWRLERFSRLSFYTAVSPLGVGEHVSTNVSPKLDIRIFENFFPVNHSFTQSQFDISLHIRWENAGLAADYYPFHRAFHISPGLLFYNRNRVNAFLKAQQNAVFTINNTDWYSDNADPVYGTGRLDLGGSGLMITAGYGHITSHSEKHWTFPFQAGVAFIHTPKTSFVLNGEICNSTGAFCQPAATYPGFANALAAQLVTWNNDVAPYHIFPILEGGVAYTFRLRQKISRERSPVISQGVRQRPWARLEARHRSATDPCHRLRRYPAYRHRIRQQTSPRHRRAFRPGRVWSAPA